MKNPASLETLIDALRRLPGIGPKTAQRLAYHLLQKDRAAAKVLGDSLISALETVRHCQRCNNFSESEVCERCAADDRDASLLCVVETPIDLNMLEQTLSFRGMYYVLMGRISPLDGVAARDLNLDKLLNRVRDGVVSEVVLATNYTNEGEATAHYISALLRATGVRVTRIARGIPVGGELEYVDSGTLAQALRERKACEL